MLVGKYQDADLGALHAANGYSGHPFDLTKTRLQTASPGTYNGAIDVVKKTLAKDGVSGCDHPITA